MIDAIGNAANRHGFRIDLIPLGGFMLKLIDPVLEMYSDRIINVHPADLSILKEDGRRRYTGDHAVLDVVKDRRPSTKSTIHIVTEKLDCGEILVQKGMPIDYPDSIEDWKKFADEVQARQKKECDWPAYVAALQMIAEGRFAIGTEPAPKTGLRPVFLDGIPLEYCGHQL